MSRQTPPEPNPPAEEFLDLLARMRTPESVAAALSLFQATPKELGQAARDAAKPDDKAG
jgi:hypothetical protein